MPARAPISLTIRDVAFGGRGVGRLEGAPGNGDGEGKAVFVPFTLPGEEVSALIVAEHRAYAEAWPLAVTRPAPERVEPPCPYFGRCGGCSYQHADYAAQLAIKRKQVADTLRRVGRIAGGPPVQETVPSPEIYGYRNRITVHARDGALGFLSHGPGERELLDIEQCPIAAPGVNAALRDLRARYRAGRLADGRDYTLRADTGAAAAGGAGSRSGRTFFQQTNDGAAARLLELVRQLALHDPGDAAGREHLVDAYCGAGFFSRALAGDFPRVTGIEWDRRAIAAAQAGAAPHELYVSGEVAAHLPAALAAAPAAGTTLILDPPAEGLAPEVARAIAARPPAVLIYVSCQPPTLARDLARWRVGGEEALFDLLSVTPLDMFPQTAEIEVVAHLRARAGR